MEHVVRFLGLMGAFEHDADLCMGELSKSLTGQAYTWYTNLKACSSHD